MRELGQPTTAVKAELISRLMRVESRRSSSGAVVENLQESTTEEPIQRDERETEWMRREMEIARME